MNFINLGEIMTDTSLRELREKELDYFYNALKDSAVENGIGDRFNQCKDVLHKALFDQKYCSSLVAEVENRLVGHLLYSTTQRNFTLHPNPGIYIHSIYVEKPFRRQGIGTRLVKELINRKRTGHNRIEFALLKNNKIGEFFLESLHFKEIDFIKPMRLNL